jgi:hypothetical protein
LSSSEPTSQPFNETWHTGFCFRVCTVIVILQSLPLLWDTKSTTHTEEVIIFIHLVTLVAPDTPNCTASKSKIRRLVELSQPMHGPFFRFPGIIFLLPRQDNDSSGNRADITAFKHFDMDSLLSNR